MTEQQDDVVLRITSQYVSELQAGGQPKLSEYIARYPHHAEAIADFVAYYHVFEISELDDLSVSAPLSEHSRSLLEQFCEEEPSTLVDSLQTLCRSKEKRVLPFSEVAQRINLSTDIVLLLEERRIDPATIPGAVVSRLAVVSGRSVDDIESYFCRRESPRHKRRKVAETSRQYDLAKSGESALPSFRDVVEASDRLSQEQKAYWLALLAQEGL